MTKFSTTKELKTIGEIYAVGNEILNDMPEAVLYNKSREELCHYVLNQFDFPPESLQTTNIDSIEDGCKTILALMSIDDNFEAENLFDKEERFDSPMDEFLYHLLDFTGLPGVFKEQLKLEVQGDLQIINDYISKYELFDFIKNKEIPRNHDQRTHIDFYNRCIEEKTKIESYLANGINERALSKARMDITWGWTLMLAEDFRDRPYKIPLLNSSKYFDINSIDKVGHRLGKIPIDRGRELKQLYETDDKKKFYTELEILNPVEKVLNGMVKRLKFLPYISEQRKLIFDELLELYQTKKWFGFYALAIPQIEGLFTEMCKMCEPKYSSPFASLPDKVNTVRPYYPFPEIKFDYFQYHFPNLRNRFLHYGLVINEEIEILSTDALYDLNKVVSIFSDLTIDANQLLRLIRKKDVSDFMSVGGLSFYFRMITSVKEKKQYSYFENEVRSFNKIFIPDIVYDVVFDLEEKIQVLINIIYEPLKVQSIMNGFEVDFETMTPEFIQNNKVKIKTSVNEVFNCQFISEIKELLEVLHFFKSYKQHLDLDFIKIEAKSKIEELGTNYAPILTKIKIIYLFFTDFK